MVTGFVGTGMQRLVAPPLATAFGVALLCIAAMGTAGCASVVSGQGATTMTLEESTAAMLSDINDVHVVVGGEWVSEGGTERSCTFGLSSGVRDSENTFADGDTDREDAIHLVKEYWQGLGYTTRERTDETPAIINRIFATTASGSELEFSAYDRGMALSGLSACAPE